MSERQQETVALLFTDIEGSTPLFLALGDRMVEVMAEHAALISAACSPHDGRELRSEGDGHIVRFPTAAGAVAAALDAQRALISHPWPEGSPVRVRMGIHWGEVTAVGNDLLGLAMAVGARVGAAAHGRQILLSDPAANAVAGRLPDGASLFDLGEHLLRGFTEPLRLHELRHLELPTGFPEPRTLSATEHNLPTPPTPMIGRDAVLARIKDLLASGSRLITLTGLGGIGKTRTALEAALTQLAYRTGGVWFCDLSAVATPDGVEPAIARALSIVEQPGRTIRDQIIARLGTDPTLLVLDNFEHVLEATPVVAALLEASEQAAFLVTSREQLNRPQEDVVALEPLSMAADRVEASEAVTLFVARARAAKAGFALDETTTASTVAVVERCQGIPLAIELAAAHVRTTGLGDIAAGLGAGLDLLSGGDRDLPDRHQALRACLGWTYDTLDDEQARAFRALAIFRGGAPLDAVDEVCGAGTSAHLQALADRSMVRLVDERVTLLEPLRHYGLERQRERDELETFASRHADWVEGLARWADLAVGDKALAMATIGREHDNARAALASPHVDLETRATTAIGLTRFWLAAGHRTEGRAWLDALLSDPDLPARLRGRVLIGLGWLMTHQGDYEAARTSLEEALELVGDDPARESQALTVSAELARKSGRVEDAVTIGERAVSAGQRHEAPRYLRAAQLNLAFSQMTVGRVDDALAGFRIVEEASTEDGDGSSATTAKHGIAMILNRKRDFEAAEALFMDVIGTARGTGDRQSAIVALNNVSSIWLEQGNVDAALAGFEEVLVDARETGDRNMVAASHYNFSMCYSATDDPRTVTFAVQAAEEWRELGNLRWTSIALGNAAVGSASRDPAAAARYLSEAIELADDDQALAAQVLLVYGTGLKRHSIHGWEAALTDARARAEKASRPDLVAAAEDELAASGPRS